MDMNESAEIGWSHAGEDFVDEEQNFILDALRDREPVEFFQGRSYVIVTFLAKDKAASSILKPLYFVYFVIWKANKETISIVNPGCHKCMDKFFG